MIVTFSKRIAHVQVGDFEESPIWQTSNANRFIKSSLHNWDTYFALTIKRDISKLSTYAARADLQYLTLPLPDMNGSFKDL